MLKFEDKEFNLFGNTYNIRYVDKIDSLFDNTFISGLSDSSAAKVTIAKLNSEGNYITDYLHKVTLLHELIHSCLDDGLFFNESLNEPMVEWLAKCIKSLIDQNII